jgi:hypothetical protein
MPTLDEKTLPDDCVDAAVTYTGSVGGGSGSPDGGSGGSGTDDGGGGGGDDGGGGDGVDPPPVGVDDPYKEGQDFDPCFTEDTGFPEIYLNYSIRVHPGRNWDDNRDYLISLDPNHPNVKFPDPNADRDYWLPTVEQSDTAYELLMEDLQNNPDWDYDYRFKFERSSDGSIYISGKSNRGHGYSWSLVDGDGNAVQPLVLQSYDAAWREIDAPVPPQPCPF